MAFYMPIHSHSHAINSHSFPFPFSVLCIFPFAWTCSHSHSHAVDRNMNLLAIYVEKTSLLKTAIPELCRFCFVLSCSVSKNIIEKRINMCHKQGIAILLYSITIYHSRRWESIPMGIEVISIPILVGSHSYPHSQVLILILVLFPWDSHSNWDSQSHAHL